ncbi:hypothetical protein Dimus_030305, partial [Dionaea muscipula]
MVSIGKDNDPKEYKGLERVIYQEPIAAEGSQSTPHIHDHFEQAIKSILDGMEEQNRGIFSLYELLDSKIFTDNQKEKLSWGKLKEIKLYLESISKELRGLSITLKTTMLDVVNLISEKIIYQSSLFKDHLALMELRAKKGSTNLQHLMKQQFLEQDTRLKGIKAIIKE